MKKDVCEESDLASLPSLGELTVSTYVPVTQGHDKDDRKDCHWCDRVGAPDGCPDQNSQGLCRNYYVCWRMRELCDAIYNE